MNSLKEKEKKFIEEKENIRKKYINDLDEYINSIKQKAEEKLENIKEKTDYVVIKQIEELIENKIEENVVFNIGDNVRINDNEQIGSIIEINGDRATINLNGITIKVKTSDLTIMPKIEKKEKYQERIRLKSVNKEINLVGERVEDALVILEEYLDKANGARLSSVKVIHGIGTGSLRKAIRDRLSKLSYIKSFKDGDFYDGGSAVTIVEFK